MARKGNSARRRRPNPATVNRTARVGELIRRIVAEELEHIDDERLTMVSITDVDVDRELHRAVVWFTTLDGDDDPDVAAAFAELRGPLRKAVSSQARLRKTPMLEFRPDTVLRSAQRIEELLANDDRPPVPDLPAGVDDDGDGDGDDGDEH